MMTQPVYLIDASIYIFRAYFSLPDQWHSPEGYSVNALYGYVRFLLQCLNKTQAKHVACAFDESLGTCFRNDIYSDYKSSRVLPDEDLAFQLSACQRFTHLLGIQSLVNKRYEADDIIATLTQLSRQHQQDVCIVSRDKDLGQLLLGNNDSWWDFSADRKITRHNFIDYFGVQPEQVVDYLSLVGDSVDDIPGVPGIGKKTAISLLSQFVSIDEIYKSLDEVSNSSIRGAKRIVKALQDYQDQVMMARQLVCLHTEVPIDVNYHQLLWKPPKMNVIKNFLETCGLHNLDKQLAQCYWWQ